MQNIHILKIERLYFNDVINGLKDFEIIKNDRNFQQGDFVIMEEIFEGKLTGNKTSPREITFLFNGENKFGLSEGYCIFQTKPVGKLSKPLKILPPLSIDDSIILSKKLNYTNVDIKIDDCNDENIIGSSFLNGYNFAKSIINELSI